jgi:hypothetical protein
MTFIEVEKNKISTRNETETMKSLISAQPIQLEVQTKTRLKYKVTSESEVKQKIQERRITKYTKIWEGEMQTKLKQSILILPPSEPEDKSNRVSSKTLSKSRNQNK